MTDHTDMLMENQNKVLHAVEALIRDSAHQDRLYPIGGLLVEYEEPIGSNDHFKVSGSIPETTLVRNDGSTIELDGFYVERFMSDGLQAAFPEAGWQDVAGGPCVPSYQLIEDLEVTPERQQAFDAAVQRMTEILQNSKEQKTSLSTDSLINLLISLAPKNTFGDGVKCGIQTKGETVEITFDNFAQHKDPHYDGDSRFNLGKGNNRNAARKLDAKDAKILGNALKEIFPRASHADIHIDKRTVTLSEKIIEQLQLKHKDETLEKDFATTIAQVQASTQQRGGRG